MHQSQSFLFHPIIALRVLGVVTTHPQEHKATASSAFGKYYTVMLSAVLWKSWNFQTFLR
jgi:hypothetical protein